MVDLLAPTHTETTSSGTGRERHPGIIRFGDLTIGQGLPGEVVARILRLNWAKMRSCYEGVLTQNPKLEGQLQLLFSIDANGVLVEPRIGAASFANPKLVSCLLDDLTRLAFPVPEVAPVTVSLPIQFWRTTGQPLSSQPSTEK